ncbi:rhomboid domain-containing protein 2 [Gastrophryne carolinensis]
MEGEKSQRSSWGKVLRSWLPELSLTPASTLTMLLSAAISGPALIRKARGDIVLTELDLEAGVLEKIQVHRLLTYLYFHEDLPTLASSCFLIWYFGGGFEENIGTLKFFFLTPLFAVCIGLLYLSLISVGIDPQPDITVQGFTAVAFTMITIFIMHTNLRRFMFCGFMLPVKVMPVVFLIVALLLPHSTVLCNVCGILVGAVYGLGGCFFLDPPELLLSRLDQMLPFRILKLITVWRYIPATLAERNASQNRKINPPPGSYPTQQYYTPQPDLQDIYSPYHNTRSKGTWPPAGVSNYPLGASPAPLNQHLDCSGGYAHSHINNTPSADLGSSSPNSGNSHSQTQLLQVETRE